MDMRGVDLNLLVAFNALMAERNVTRAAKRIGRTQPAMSAALARLRTLLKDDLFLRGSKGLRPTPRAYDLEEPIARALQEIERTLGFVQEFDPANAKVEFKLGLSEHPTYKLLPGLVESLRRHAPGVSLHVRTYTAREDALSMLDGGDIDAAVGVPPYAAPGRILVKPLFEEPFVCILRKGHPAAAGPLDLTTFLSLSHVLVSPEGDRFGHVDTALAEQGLKRHLAVTFPQVYAAPLLVARSDMVATVMAGVVDHSEYADDLCILAPPLKLAPVLFVLCWHRRNDAHPAQRWLRQCIEQQAGVG